MNNKGQVLVIFILLLPILMLLFAMITDIGMINLKKKEISSKTEDIIIYGLNNMDNANLSIKLDNMINNEIGNVESKNISISNEKIEISFKLKINGLFEKIFDEKIYNLRIDYKGIIDKDKIRIER